MSEVKIRLSPQLRELLGILEKDEFSKEKYASVIREIKDGEYSVSKVWCIGVLTTELTRCGAPDELLKRAANGEFTPTRPASPAIDEATELAVIAAEKARSAAKECHRLTRSGSVDEIHGRQVDRTRPAAAVGIVRVKEDE